ncbi:longitudinals lacking protein, isoforms A/B/D/L-like isoform X1 [Hylaeus anthracinus]|uniref:longitudinals lacking protein, isoforms A/B/D/L-like isoform X1 n=1 Tax=Hylaeus anthracinus TaxID=313031 RepID=UPI0023BA2683|nr:longitudinals lacking protein, isoforms A/B/D/L-like isoform X1 [Hylaeus anthracinus]XP_053996845.1 longitudinals lacking protein, isoforms A/B/D/L-like isoform X1 [Hylaeus anthracinus]
MEDDQQFCLRWNNHQSTLIQNFDTLLESGTLVDCTLAAEGKYLKAHKVVLSACSPYFEGLLSEHYDKHPVFILKDVKFKELKAMMDYMYRGEVNISQDQLAALLKAAESLQIKGLSESKTGGSSKTDTRQQKVVPQATAPSLDIPHASSGLTIEKNKVPRQAVPPMAQGSVGDLLEESSSPQLPKGLSSREGSQSPTSRKRKRFRRRSVGEDTIENHEASNSSDMPQQMGVPALGIAPVADEKVHADPTDTLGRSALMTQLTKPADEMLQLPLEKPEPNDNLIEPKSEYLEDPEESVEDLTLDDDMNDLNEMEQDNNRAGPSHDPSQHPAGIGAWHVTGDRSNAGGVVGSVAGAPGTTDEVFLAAQEAAQAHRDSQGHRDGPRYSYRPFAFVDEGHHPCPTCSRIFKRKNSLSRHLLYACGQNPRFKCPYCGLYYANARYRKPRVRFNDLSHKRFPCPNCPSVFVWKCTLKRHMRNECGKEPRFKCPHCEYRGFGRRWQFGKVVMRPSRYRRLQAGVYVCPSPNCSKSFSWKGNLNRHLRYECGLQPRFKCPYCEYRCKVKGDVSKHILRKHHGSTVYVLDLFTA